MLHYPASEYILGIRMIAYHNISFLDSPASPCSHVAATDDLICVSGLTAADSAEGRKAKGKIAGEARVVMDQLSAVLRARGSSMAEVIRVDIHLIALKDLKVVDRIYARYFAPGRFPARTCVEVRRLYGGSRIEVTAMARRSKPA